MKTARLWLAGMTVALVTFALVGCDKSEKGKVGTAAGTGKTVEVTKPAEQPAAAEKAVEAAKPAENPAAQKPKDHPAH